MLFSAEKVVPKGYSCTVYLHIEHASCQKWFIFVTMLVSNPFTCCSVKMLV